MGSGIKVVGGTAVDAATATAAIAATAASSKDDRDPRDRRDRRRRRPGVVVVCVLAVLGVAGTIVFGTAWAGLHSAQTEEAQVSAEARTFLVDLTNFDAKTVDVDFAAITSMATGQFAGQADKFFNSSIRQELQRALASSRGQVRNLFVQNYGGTQASVYAVVTQLYSNNKITSPQSDVLRVVVDLRQVRGTWKVADVTVLEGPSQGSAPTVPSTGSPPGG